ncbi:Sec-independent protein translocase protein TatB [Rhizobium sp. XQZ8]|uniref:Sec-independent protein translocase protein TatB n=1 Tax=Rhizobium populisoli TaxID=2859785 RepID=UPI001CA4B3E0|nr:Sec-independent protein translocase protein TatB [Rhizobium populisoli]MBW6420163.1 Sec-independent protein translocase protein TatB [Rhizobium populisoli]
MFDIGWTELLVIAIVLIVVVGPKDLPPMLRAFGKMTANLRKMAGEFRTQFDEALRESELDDVRKTISDAQSLNPTNALRDAINPLRQMGQDIRADLQKATQMPTPAATPELSPTDIEAQQAVEGTETVNPAPEIPANFPSPAAVNTAAAPVAAAPAQSAPAAPAAAVTAEPAAKPKAVRKTTAKVKPVAETVAEPVVVTEKPKRTRVAKPTVTSDEVLEAAKKSLARKRATKKTDTPKGDA